MSQKVLLVDDDRSFTSVSAAALRREGLEVTVARSLREAREAVALGAPDLVLLDRRLPDGDGLDYLPELRQRMPTAAVLMVTAHADIQSAVDAMRAGASDYLTKPVELADLVAKTRRTLDTARLRERLHVAESELSGRHRLITPASPQMRAVTELLARVARAPRSPLLLLGETGTGKEVMARHFHALACPDDAPFVHLNCAALPESTFESELFGHERGAFTDARASRRGLAEVASGGILFLDEIGELPLALQAKLLVFLDSGRFRRLGGTAEQTSSARVVAATNRDLSKEVDQGRFRQDLLFRLSVFQVELPPLRERTGEVLPLAEGLLSTLAAELGRRGVRLGDRARERLERYAFPGNVRELRNLLERALVLEPGPDIELEALAAPQQQPSPGDPHAFRVEGSPVPLEEVSRRYARHVLAQLGGRRMEAAQALGVSYPTFLKRIEGD